MKYAFVAALFLLAACAGKQQQSREEAGSVEVKYAHHFKLDQKDGYVELQILNPENGELERTWALVKTGTKPVVPQGVDQISVPVKNMAVLSTTHIGMLDALKALDCIKGSTDVNFISNPTIQQGIRSGKINQFTDESSLTPERLLEKEISLIVYSGFGKAFSNEQKLAKLGIYAMANYDWREEHPLGKAEWIKLFGFLTGKEKEAMTYFSQVEKSYNDTKKELEKVKKRPSVLVGSLIGDIWYAPAGESYMAHILRDAGADYIYCKEKGTGSCEHTLEQVFIDQQEVDIWINPGAVSLAGLEEQQAKYALFTAFKQKGVYCYTHNSSYFWEMGAVNPHWLLSDFATIIGTKSGEKLHFYKKLE